MLSIYNDLETGLEVLYLTHFQALLAPHVDSSLGMYHFPSIFSPLPSNCFFTFS